MSNFDYLGFYTERLKYVIKQMITDIGSKIDKQKFWIRTENALQMKAAAASIEKCGIRSANLYAVLKNFELTDVTDKLMEILRDAKRQGEELKAKYPLALGTLSTQYSKDEIIDPDNAPSFIDTCLLYYHFINLVADGKKYDIKRNSDWQYDLQYYFDGMILDYDDPGNIAYGVIAKATGITESFAHKGAGAANFYDAIKNALKSKEMKKEVAYYKKTGIIPDTKVIDEAFLRELSYWRTNFDDPRDAKMINLGIGYYNKL